MEAWHLSNKLIADMQVVALDAAVLDVPANCASGWRHQWVALLSLDMLVLASSALGTGGRHWSADWWSAWGG